MSAKLHRDVSSLLALLLPGRRSIALILLLLYGSTCFYLGSLKCHYSHKGFLFGTAFTGEALQSGVALKQIEHEPREARVAIATLADMDYLGCATRLVRSVRAKDWDDDVIVMTIGKGNQTELNELKKLGVAIVKTEGILDKFVPKRLHASKFRKMELFLNPLFRKYDYVIYMDSDGLVKSSLRPYLDVKFPTGKTVLMQENSYNTGKGALYETSLLKNLPTLFKSKKDFKDFRIQYPDRHGNGASAWFLVDMRRIAARERLLRRFKGFLQKYHMIFAFNDQTLMNFVFYDEVGFFSTCSKYEIKYLERAREFHPYCMWVKKRLRKNEENTFLYRHGDKGCVRGRHSRFF